MTRSLKRYMSGTDVRELKETLLKLGYYDKKITKITNSTYGNDTYKAVKAFQKEHGLTVDGIFGTKSNERLQEILSKEAAKEQAEYVTAKEYPRISETVRKAINTALNGKEATLVRRKVVLEALKYATDATIASKYTYPSSLYIRGGNLYNTDGKLNVITEKYLTNTYAKKYADYCTNGRLELMKKSVNANPDITGADCSGGIIGILRHFGLISMKTDASANTLLGTGYSASIKKTELTAGDFVGKSGHICLYAGGGYMVEWAGGEYGCQITSVSKRKCWSFTKKKMKTMSACTKYRKTKLYK